MTKLDGLPRQNNIKCNSCGAWNPVGTGACFNCEAKILDYARYVKDGGRL